MTASSGASDPDEPVGLALARLRKARRLTGAQLAGRVGMSQPKISRIERGTGVIDPEDVGTLARALGASEFEIRALMQRAEQSHDRMTDWRAPSLSLAGRQKTMSDWEAAAEFTRQFESVVVPGLLQTSGYATALLRSVQRVAPLAAEDLTDSSVLTAVSARIRRQEVLAEQSKTFHFVMTEAVLRNPICSPVEMLAQIGHIREVAQQRRNVRVGVIPEDETLELPALHGFTLFDESLVVLDVFNTGLISRSRRDLESYRRVFDMFDLHAAEVEPILDKYQDFYLGKLRG